MYGPLLAGVADVPDLHHQGHEEELALLGVERVPCGNVTLEEAYIFKAGGEVRRQNRLNAHVPERPQLLVVHAAQYVRLLLQQYLEQARRMVVLKHCYVVVGDCNLVLGVDKEGIRATRVLEVMTHRGDKKGEAVDYAQPLLDGTASRKVSDCLEDVGCVNVAVVRIGLVFIVAVILFKFEEEVREFGLVYLEDVHYFVMLEEDHAKEPK
mmetsp:Transcript_7920/g.15892  ORF Transcript_7920/g.15892 Transcript_7920/m.15892 type:complete len:210 (+) Transcript_7920:313-942(+)